MKLEIAYHFTRHISPVLLNDLLDEVRAAVECTAPATADRGQRCDVPEVHHVCSQSAFDPWAAAAATRGLRFPPEFKQARREDDARLCQSSQAVKPLIQALPLCRGGAAASEGVTHLEDARVPQRDARRMVHLAPPQEECDDEAGTSLDDVMASIHESTAVVHDRIVMVSNRYHEVADKAGRLETHLKVLEAQLRAAERTLARKNAESDERVARIRQDVDQRIVADALSPHRDRGPRTAEDYTEAAPPRPAPRPDPSPAPNEEEAVLSHLARSDACNLRAASWQHAFLPALG